MANMSRLVGVGFLVGAKDDGATETFDNVARSVDRTADAAEKAGSSGGRGVGMFRRALEGIASVNLANISSTLDSIAERAGAGGIGMQSTALESYGAQFNQTARAAEARLGSMSGAMQAHRGEISSLGYAYGISGDEMFAALGPLSRLGVDIEEVFGDDATRALAGHLQAGIIGGQAFGQTLAELVGVYDMAPDAAGGMVDSLMAIGDRFGFVAEVGQGLPAIMDAIRPVAARYPGIAADVDGVAGSITRLAAGMINMGMAPEQAMQAATQTFTSLSENRDAFTDMISGVSSAFPEMAQEIGISTGDIEGSMEAVMSSPVEFAQRMGQAMADLGPMDPMAQRLTRTLREISPELLNVVRNASEGGDALRRATEPIEGVEDAFNRMGRSALTSTLTFSEQIERMSDAYQTRLNSIGRATDRNFVQRQSRAYKEVGDKIADFAKRDGVLGSLTRGFLRVRTFGLVQGLLPQLGVLGEGFGDTAAAAGPLFRVMGDTGLTKSFAGLFQQGGRLAGVTRILGTTFLGVLGPIALVAGAGYLIYRNWERIPTMFEDLAKGLTDVAQRFGKWVNSIDWRDMGDRVVSGILSLFDKVGEGVDDASPTVAQKIGSAFSRIFASAGQMIGGLATGMWNRVIEWITDPPNIEAQVSRAAQAIGATIGGVLGIGMLTPLRSNIISTFGRLFSGFGNLMTGGGAGGGALRLAGGGAKTLLRRIPYVGAILGVLFDLPEIISSFQTGGVVAGLRQIFERVVDGLLMGLPSLIGGLTGTENVVEKIFDFLFEGLNIANIQEAIDAGQIGRAILEGLMAIGGGGFARMLWESLLGEGSGDAIMTGMGQVLEAVGSIFTEIGSAYSTMIEPLWEAFSEAGGQIMDIFGQLWTDTLQPLFNDIWNSISPVTEVFDSVSTSTEDISGSFDNAAAGVRGFAEMAGDFIRERVVPAILWLAENVLPLVVQGVEMFADHVRRVVDFWRAAWPTIETVFDYIKQGFDGIADAVTWWWETVTEPILTGLYDTWTEIFGYIIPLVEGAFEIFGDIVSWWWENITEPVLSALDSVFGTVIGAVVDAAKWAFDVIGGVVSWWWENITWPILRTLKDVFVFVVETIAGAVRTVFNWMSSFITNRIEEAALAFHLLKNSWEAVKDVLSTGFQLIGAKVNQFLVVPFLRVQGVIVGMADMIQMAFLSVKESVLDMFKSIIESFQNFIRGTGVPGANALADAFNPAKVEVERALTGIRGRGGERSQLRSSMRESAAARQSQIDEANRRAEEQMSRYREAQSTLGGAALDYQRQQAEMRREQAAREAQREQEDRDRVEQEAERRRQEEMRRAATIEERNRLRAEQQAEREAERQARRDARAQTDARRQQEQEEQERQERRNRRGRGARRGASRELTPEQMGEALTQAMASGPGSSRESPSHVVIERVNATPGGGGGVPRQPPQDDFGR